jgi:hypothetical protein
VPVGGEEAGDREVDRSRDVPSDRVDRLDLAAEPLRGPDVDEYPAVRGRGRVVGREWEVPTRQGGDRATSRTPAGDLGVPDSRGCPAAVTP